MRPLFLLSHCTTALSDAHPDIEHLPVVALRRALGARKDRQRAVRSDEALWDLGWRYGGILWIQSLGSIEGISSSASCERVYNSAIRPV